MILDTCSIFLSKVIGVEILHLGEVFVLVFLCDALSAMDRDGTNVLIKWVVVATVSGPARPVVKPKKLAFCLLAFCLLAFCPQTFE